MKTLVKGLLDGGFDSSAFFTGISTFVSGIVDDSVNFVRNLITDVKEALEETITEIPFLKSILTFVSVKVFGPVLKVIALMKALVAGLLSGEPGSPAFFQGIADFASDFASNAAQSIKDLLVDVKEIIAEKLPDVPFLQDILMFGINVFSRVINLMSTMKELVTGILGGEFDSSAFFQGIADFALGIAGDAAQAIKDLLSDVKTIVAETLPDVPFLQSILTFGINVFSRVINLMSTMKELVTGILSGDEGAGGAFASSIVEFTKGIIVDATGFLDDVIASLGNVDFGAAGAEAGKLAGTVISKITEWFGTLTLGGEDSSIGDLMRTAVLASLLALGDKRCGGLDNCKCNSSTGWETGGLMRVYVKHIVSNIVSSLIDVAVSLIGGLLKGLGGEEKRGIMAVVQKSANVRLRTVEPRVTVEKVIETLVRFRLANRRHWCRRGCC